MANEIEIRVTSKDDSGPGLSSAARKADGLKASVEDVGKSSDKTKGKVAGLDTEAEKLGKGTETAAAKSGKLSGALGKVGTVAAGILTAKLFEGIASKATDFIHSTTEAASSLGESLNATNKIFGSNAGQIQSWAKSNANSLGLSQRAFNEMATPLGAMLKNSGLDMDTVTSSTTKLTERAADLASVFNTSVPEALGAIQAGLRGESDPLERFGVGLSAAAVEARALADSGKKSVTELTNQEKMLARLAIIYDQTNSSAGDFRQTSDGLANSQRIATAQIEDAKAKIGSAFIPVMATAAQITGTLAEAVGNLPGPAQVAIAGVVGLGAAALMLAPRIIATKEALDKMRDSDSGLQRGLSKGATLFARYAGTLGAITAGAQLLGSVTGSQLNPQVDALTVGLSEWARGGKLAGESARILGDNASNLADIFGNMNAGGFSKGFAHAIEGLTNTGDSFNDSAKKTEERIGAIDGALSGLVGAGKGDQAAEIFSKFAAQAVAVGLPLDKLKAAFPQYAAAMEVAAKQTGKVADKAQDAAVNLDDLDKAFKGVIDSAFAVAESEDSIATAVQRLTDQVKQQKDAHEKGAGTLDRNTQAGRDNADMVRELVRKYEDLMITYQKNGKSTDGLIKKLEDQLVTMGIARDVAHDYASKLANVKQGLDAIPNVTDKVVNMRVNQTQGLTFGGMGRIQDRATGGISSAATGGARSGLVRMNEQGGELVRLPNGSMVYPHGQSQRMLDQGLNFGGGGNNEPIVIQLELDDAGLLKANRRVVSRYGNGSAQVTFGRKG